MYYDKLVSALERLAVNPNNTRQEETLEDVAELKQAKLLLLDSEQVEIFIKNSYPLKYYPHFIFDKFFVNFTRPIEFKWKKEHHFLENEVLTSSKESRYQGMLVCRADITSYMGLRIPAKNLANMDKENFVKVLGHAGAIDGSAATEPVQGALVTWYESLPKDEMYVDASNLTIDPATFPNIQNICSKFNITPEQRDVIDNYEVNSILHRVTTNILYFLSCENIKISYHEPKGSKELFKKIGQKTQTPLYTVEFKRGGDRTKSYETGKGGTHSFRYDVQGHPRHLVDECYHRNRDGTYKVLWIDKHQRGLKNELYVPAIRDATKVPKTIPDS